MNTKELKSTKLYKEYSLEIPYEEIDIEVDNKINQILPTVNIPGFRKGHTPFDLIKKSSEIKRFEQIKNIKKIPFFMTTYLRHRKLLKLGLS